MSAAADEQSQARHSAHHRSRGVYAGRLRCAVGEWESLLTQRARCSSISGAPWIEAIISAIRGPRSMKLRERIGNATN